MFGIVGKKHYGLLVVMVLMVVGLFGCSSTKENENSAANVKTNAVGNETVEQVQTTNNEEVETAVASKATVYPLKVKDATGKEFIFNQAPQRIVSTSVSETEILFALGLGDQVVGVSDYDNYPAEVLDKPKVGGVTKPNVEVIIASNADLVIAGISMKTPVVEQFRSLHVNLFKTDPQNADDILDNILLFGVINDKQLKAEAVVAQMREDIRKVTEAVAEYSRKQLSRKVAVLQQEALPPVNFTVREVVEMGRFPYQNWLGEERADHGQLVDSILDQLGFTGLQDRSLLHLSGGERQWVALGKVMAQQPELLLLDEPTTYLDIGYQIQMMDHIKAWQNQANITVIAVLHELNLASIYCD